MSRATSASASLDPNQAARGGDTGVLIRGALEPALQEAAFAAPVGQPFGPGIRSPTTSTEVHPASSAAISLPGPRAATILPLMKSSARR